MNYPKPEVGLAEWTSKIKAMQREVDADEEAEQRKLEEEIRVSRLARSRRSFGANDAALDICEIISYIILTSSILIFIYCFIQCHEQQITLVRMRGI